MIDDRGASQGRAESVSVRCSTAVPNTATPSLAPTPTVGTRFPSLEMRLDGSIDSWLPSDTIKLKRRVGAMLGVQSVDNLVVKARAGSIVVTLTILEGKNRAMCSLFGAWAAQDVVEVSPCDAATQPCGSRGVCVVCFSPKNARGRPLRLAQPAPSLPC